MILAIDCGNTHITVGCVDERNTAHAVFRLPTDTRETDHGYAAKLNQILSLEGIDISTLKGAAISSVVPPVTPTLVRAVEIVTKKTPLVVGAGVKTGLHICINDPGTVASDLVVSAVAAKTLYPTPCIIVDMGTATTVTAVDEKGRFIGAAIAPGAMISLEALAQRTALLPHVDMQPPRSPIGACTVDSMKAGIVYGMAGLVDGLLERFETELNATEPTVIATGGVAPMIVSHCKHKMTQEPDLLLKGLRMIWDKNRHTVD